MNLAKHINQREWYFYYYKSSFYYYEDGEWKTIDFIGLSDAKKHAVRDLNSWPPINHKDVKIARLALNPGSEQSYTIQILDNKED